MRAALFLTSMAKYYSPLNLSIYAKKKPCIFYPQTFNYICSYKTMINMAYINLSENYGNKRRILGQKEEIE